MVDIPKTLEDLPTSSPRWIGKSVKKVEDPMLVTGRAEFIDNQGGMSGARLNWKRRACGCCGLPTGKSCSNWMLSSTRSSRRCRRPANSPAPLFQRGNPEWRRPSVSVQRGDLWNMISTQRVYGRTNLRTYLHAYMASAEFCVTQCATIV